MKMTFDLNTIKRYFENLGYKFTDGAFENSINEFIEKYTDDNGVFNGPYGKLNPPDNEIFVTDIMEASHKIDNIDLSAMTVTLEFLDTSDGNAIQSLLNNAGLNYSVSSHAKSENLDTDSGKIKPIDFDSIKFN